MLPRGCSVLLRRGLVRPHVVFPRRGYLLRLLGPAVTGEALATASASRICTTHADGRVFRYADLQRASGEVQSLLQLMTDSAHLRGARVGVLTHAAFDWVATVLGTCRAGGTAVLLSNKHSPAELRYAIGSVGCSVVVTTPDFANAAAAAVEDLEDLRAVLVVNPMQADAPIEATRLQQALQLPNAPLPADGRRTLAMSEEERLPVHAQPPPLGADEVLGNTPATIVFTSGTTGRPKGVLMTHTNLYSNITAMQKEWAWSAEDRVVNILPLHHIHGAFNVVLTALASGAPCEMHMGFDAATVFDRLAGITSGEFGDTRATPGKTDLTVFMAVPTIYSLLLREYSSRSEAEQQAFSEATSQMRLMVSGSAALPLPTFRAWQRVTGHELLERYGMTEIGMALTNPLRGPRLPGYVGRPFPGVQTKIVPDDPTKPPLLDDRAALDHETAKLGLRLGDNFSALPTSQFTGQLFIKGPGVFQEYFNNREATREEFDAEGYFKTGDIAMYDSAHDAYAIVGRASVDIIKSAGYKIGALEIEREVLAHPLVVDVAVLGVPDEEFGERVAAIVQVQPGSSLTLEELQDHLKETLAKYKWPTLLRTVGAIPRNAMGKINKRDLRRQFFADKVTSPASA